MKQSTLSYNILKECYNKDVNNGSAEITRINDIPIDESRTYIYAWDNGEVTNPAVKLKPGKNTVTITIVATKTQEEEVYQGVVTIPITKEKVAWWYDNLTWVIAIPFICLLIGLITLAINKNEPINSPTVSTILEAPIPDAPTPIISSIHFESNSSILEDSSQLDTIIEIMNNFPELNLTIIGHTDTIGTGENNSILALERAESCMNYLFNQGISDYRISGEGLGESQPISNLDSLNRRVEFVFYY